MFQLLLPRVSSRHLPPHYTASAEKWFAERNVTYCLHAAHGCVKLQSKQTYGIHTTDNIYKNSTVQLASVRPAQACSNYFSKQLQDASPKYTEIVNILC